MNALQVHKHYIFEAVYTFIEVYTDKCRIREYIKYKLVALEESEFLALFLGFINWFVFLLSRDLKPENILLDHEVSVSVVFKLKLCFEISYISYT